MTHKTKLKAALMKGLEERLKDRIANKKFDNKRITELQSQIYKPKERFVLNEISKDQFVKFTQKSE